MPSLVPKARHDLAKLLADCYRERASAEHVASGAGLDLKLIAFHPRAADTWASIVEAAVTQEKLDDLLDLVLEEQTGAEVSGKLRGFRSGTGTKVSIGRLPVTTTRLFGREKELAWLEACWAEGVRVGRGREERAGECVAPADGPGRQTGARRTREGEEPRYRSKTRV